MKQKRTQVLLLCPGCNKEYYKDESEAKRNNGLNRTSYCSLSCSSRATILSKIPMSIRRVDHLLLINRKDEFTDFRYYIKMIKQRSKERNKLVTLSLTDLKEQWNKQNGICPYTKFLLIPQTHTKDHLQSPYYKWASLDRINSLVGYETGNIEFVSLAVNFMKNKYSKEQTIEFINLLKQSNNSDRI